MRQSKDSKHIEDAATWTRQEVVRHIKQDHGGVPDEDAPWQNHRQIHHAHEGGQS